MTSAVRSLLSLLAVLALAPGARAQGAAAGAPDPVRVLVPKDALQEVLRRHPGGVVLEEVALRALLERARARRAAASELPAPISLAPVGAALERLRLRGRVDAEGVAELEAEAEVAVLWPGTVRLALPLRGLGLLGVSREDGAPARLVAGRAGPEVLLEGLRPGEGARAIRRLRWTFWVRTIAGDEPGSGSLTLPVPAAASASLALVVPGEQEPLASTGDPVSASAREGATELRLAFGGEPREQVRLGWRPRRPAETAPPYVAAESRTILRVRSGVVVLAAEATLEVHRAPVDRLALELPPGFVVRSLEVEPGEESYVQRGDRVEVLLAAPRQGALAVRVAAEQTTLGEGAREAGGSAALTLRPVRWLGAARAAGLLAIAADPEVEVELGASSGLERADLAAVAGREAGDAALLRAYRLTGSGQAEVALRVRAVEPRAGLTVKAALELREREVRALAVYQFRVEAGTVFRVRADLPAGYAPVRTLVRDLAGGEPAHALERRVLPDGRRGLEVELEQGLRPGDGLLVTVEAVWEVPADRAGGLAGSALPAPRFGGEPAAWVRGYLGFAPDPAFQLAGRELSGLAAIPADELPRAGLEVPGLVLGYRIDEAGYGGEVVVRRRETRLAAEVNARHAVAERRVSSDVALAVTVEGAPVLGLELLLPAGTGRDARIEGPSVRDERELLGLAADGRERWRVRLTERVAGRVELRVRLETALGEVPGSPERLEGALPRVGVGGAYRERGTLAVFSADAVELTAEAEGLRAMEVTELPAHPHARPVVGMGELERPLFAYRHIDASYGLVLRARRHAPAPVLTAVAERLELATSAGPDGAARHQARFAIKNLANQFFALRLPEGATLWSVVVDGEGVKPAARAGVAIVPLPGAGTQGPDELTEVVATYTHRGEPWGLVGDARLIAPQLLVSESADEPVPVLHTEWTLALPEDYRVLETRGNLEPARRFEQARPLLLSSDLRQALRGSGVGGLGALALVALLIGASRRLRAGALATLAAALGAGGSLGSGAAGLAARLTLRRALACLGLAALLGGCCLVMSVMTASRERYYELEGAVRQEVMTSAPPPRAAEPGDRFFPGEARGRSAKKAEDQGWSAGGGQLGDADGEDGAQPTGALAYGDFAEALEEEPTPAPPAPQLAEKPKVAEAADLDLASEPLAAPKPAPPEVKLDLTEERLVSAPVDLRGATLADAMATYRLMLGKDIHVADAAAQLRVDIDTAALDPFSAVDLLAAKAGLLVEEQPDGSLRLVPAAKVQRSEPELAAGGQVGLRSLVLALPAIGQRYVFSRPGGGATLAVRAVHEPALVALGGALALAAFALALGAPRLSRLSGVALLAVGLALATGLPLLAPSPWLGPVCNGLALGLALAAPALALIALAEVWRGAPFARLGRALAEARERR